MSCYRRTMVDYKRVMGFGVAFGLLSGCGGDGSGTDGDSGSSGSAGSTGSATMQVMTTGDPSGSGSMTDSTVTQGSMSATDSQGTTVATVTDSVSATDTGPGTDSSPGTDTGSTGTTSAVSETSGTSGGPCDVDLQCGDECCAPGELCTEGQCQTDCGGPPPCGPQQECCAAGDLCNQGQCVTPAGPCAQATCATLAESECPEGFVCDVKLELCLPSQADASCQYIPPKAEFEPVPNFTWGSRAKVACNMASQCQTAEVCDAGFCKVTWPHLNIAVDDLPTHNQSSSIPVVADIDRDCVPEIVFNSYRPGVATSDGVMRAIRGDTGAKVWTVTDPAWRTDSTASPAIGDINGDGQVEIIVQGTGKTLLAFSSDGKPLWKSGVFKMATGSGAVAIANIDNDGDAEVIFGSAVFDSTGKLLYEGVPGIGLNGQGPISCVADLDNDGRQEVIAGRTAYAFTGTVAMNNFVGKVLWTAAPTDGFCGVADFNGDKKPEVVLVSNANIYALNGQTGATLAQAPIPNGGKGGPPNIADFDGDKVPEIAAAGSSQYIVYKYAGANAFVKLWSAATQDGSSQVTGSSVFDFNGDLAA